MLKKMFLATLLTLAGSFCFAEDFKEAQAPITTSDRIKNENNKRCAWNSIEMLAKRAKEKRLYGISEKYEGPATDAQILWVLQDSKVKYKMNTPGNKDLKAIYEYLVIPCEYEKRGVAVCIHSGPNMVHMFNVVHYDIKNQKVAVIDNCDPKLEMKQYDWDEFHRKWTGMAVVIYAEKDLFDRYEAVWP